MAKQITLPKVILFLLFWPFIVSWVILRYLFVNRNKIATNLTAHRPLTDPFTTISRPHSKTNTSQLIRSEKNSLTESLRIPEPTRSLLFITDEDPSKIQSPMGTTITISIDLNTGQSETTEEEKGFYAEPSLIWKKLPIKSNDKLEAQAMYWPSYAQFYPETRYQYLRWLKNIEQPTNLSYVFLYFYGLERHLLIGDYDNAVNEVLRLLKAHPKQSFRSYATSSLIAASIIRDRMDVIERAPFLLEEEIDEALALRIIKGTSMSPDDMISIASRVGFNNKRYIKLHPELFKKHLQKVIDEFEAEYGKVMSIFKLEDFKKVETSVFANMSIPAEARTAKIPAILENTKFQTAIRTALQEAHRRVKEDVTRTRAKRAL